jgi:hypothetical protein
MMTTAELVALLNTRIQDRLGYDFEVDSLDPYPASLSALRSRSGRPLRTSCRPPALR